MGAVPAGQVRAKDLFVFFTEQLGVDGQSNVTWQHHVALALEHAVDEAWQTGRIRRWLLKDPASGQSAGSSYAREDLLRFLAANEALVERELGFVRHRSAA
ncbi:MAG: hypothetical protein JOZ39_06735 [Chloroflexi bacterium]|nr:hypothetical protein [Chloroflexota bacterium]